MEITDWSISKVKPYKDNPRVISDEAVDHVAESIKEFGFQQPIVVDADGVVIVGHTRLRAAKKLKLKKVPVVVAGNLTEEQARAYRLADNKTNEFSQWDTDLLDIELGNIFELDMNLFGFEDLFTKEEEPPQETEEDDYDGDVPEESYVKLGQIYKLGEHRLMCGDSTNTKDVDRLCAGAHAKLLFTSPPYSDMREYNGEKDLSVENLSGFIPAYKPFADFQCVNLGLQRRENEIVQYWDGYIARAKQSGLKLLAWNVWDKQTAGSVGMQRALIPIRHEWIFIFGLDYAELNRTWEKKEENVREESRTKRRRQPDGTTEFSTGGDQSHKYKVMESVVSILPELGEIRHDHPATFPVALPAEYIKAFTDEGDYVIEPFGGSGTTLIASEQLGRKCRIMELDPIYCQLIINRWETYTGQKAVLLEG